MLTSKLIPTTIIRSCWRSGCSRSSLAWCGIHPRAAPPNNKYPPPIFVIGRRKLSATKLPTEPSRHSVLPIEIVTNPNIQAMLPVVGNVAYIALACGFLMTDMLSLRILLAGGYTGLVAFHMLHVHPLKIPLRWSALFVLVNASAAGFLIADQWMGNLTQQDQELYHQHFPMFSPGQFQQLLAMSRTEVIKGGTALTQEGVPCKNLYFIRQGVVNLYLKKLFMSRSSAGSFVNDVAFSQGQGAGAYGTVVTAGECTVVVWKQDELRQHLEQRPAMHQNMKHCLSSHLVKALMEQREAAHLTSGRWGDFQVPHFTPRKTVEVAKAEKKENDDDEES